MGLKGLLLVSILSFQIHSFAKVSDYKHFADDKGWTEVEELGFWLFADKRLSGNNKISCMSCHQPAKGWSDGRAKAVGFQGKVLGLRTPTIVGLGLQDDLGHPMFWDGRAQNLLEQALGPIENPNEMNQDLGELVKELSSVEKYKSKFQRAFGTEVINKERIALAIVAFERTIKSPSREFIERTPNDEQNILDRLNASNFMTSTIPYLDEKPVSEGKRLFDTHCAFCHQPAANLSDGNFHDIGLVTKDFGRANVIKADKNSSTFRMNRFKHKTPTLWGVAQRGGPYMHNGSKKTLREVLEHYNNGGSFKTKEERRQRLNTLSPAIRELHLSETDLDTLEQFITEEFRVDFEDYPLPEFLSSL